MHFTVAELIKVVYQFPILFNPDDPNFRNKNMKERYWKVIAKHLKTTSETVERKWNYLRMAYAKHLKSEMNPQKDGPIKGEWKWALHMECFRKYFRFYERQTPEVIQVAVDPNIVNEYDDAAIGEGTRDTIANFVQASVLEFMNQSHHVQQQESEQPQPTISAKKRRAAETVSSSRAAKPTTSTATRLFQPDTPGPSCVTPVAPPVEQHLNETITSSHLQEQPTMRVNAESGAALDAMDHFMLKCAKRMKKLPPDVQADLQMQISEVITHNEQDNLRKINTWQNKSSDGLI